MKRMVKNGNLLDVKPNGDLGIKGNMQVGGRLQVNSSIISTGEIRGGDISGTKFLLGTEEMPLVKANPAGDAAGTLEKIKIGDVAYKVGGGSSDREITLTMPYSSTESSYNKKLYLDDETWNNLNNKYYEIIKIYYNDGNLLGVFQVINYEGGSSGRINKYLCLAYKKKDFTSYGTWFGSTNSVYVAIEISLNSDSTGKYLKIIDSAVLEFPNIDKSKFDALYKLADKPTQDGTYVLKATVSGGAVTYTWIAQ